MLVLSSPNTKIATRAFLASLAWATLLGCSEKGDAGTQEVDAAKSLDAALVTDAALEVDAGPGATGIEMRGIVHVHSPFSHDACDELGLINGQPNAACRTKLREALCETHLDFAMLTDHPNFMRDYSFEELLLHEPASDEFIEVAGEVIANKMGCTDGHTVLLTVGYETTPHTMPLGLRHHLAPEHYTGLSDSMTTQQSVALVTALSAAGAVTAIAHSEEDNISAQFIVDSGLDAMEWYNVHGNFRELLGGESVGGSASEIRDILESMGRFTANSGSGAHPDLVNLLLLQTLPQPGLDKWREVIRTRNITGLLGSDVHENVSIDAVCDESNPVSQLACVAAAEAILPDYLHFVIPGGPLLLSDNDRIDGYPRVMRWLHNRVLVEEKTLDELKLSLKEGRSYGVFSVLGQPTGFRFQATKDGQTTLLGGSLTGPANFEIAVPSLAPVNGGADFTVDQAATAQLRMLLIRTTGTSSTVVQDIMGGSNQSFAISEPGAYHVEFWITPNHLISALGTESKLANHEYLWIISNPIRVL